MPVNRDRKLLPFHPESQRISFLVKVSDSPQAKLLPDLAAQNRSESVGDRSPFSLFPASCRITMAGNFTSSCIPHFGIFEACPERRFATRIQFVVLLAANFFAGVILLATLIRRVIVFRPLQWSNFYTILTSLAAGNFRTPRILNELKPTPKRQN
jgi:hypothetical protein